MDERGRLRRGVKINSLKRREKKLRSRQIDDEMMKNRQIKVGRSDSACKQRDKDLVTHGDNRGRTNVRLVVLSS